MIAHNIRKEISSLIYLLKKYKRNTFLIKEEGVSTKVILQNMLTKRGLYLDLSTLEVNGIEKIISSQTEFTS